MSYTLEGTILEVCNCDVLCPCWIGEDPDNGTCDAVVAWHIDRGEIDGVDVSNRTIALLGFVPGNILAGNWKAAVFVDDKASDAQMQALGDVWTGKKGGPVADVAGLVGEIAADHLVRGEVNQVPVVNPVMAFYVKLVQFFEATFGRLFAGGLFAHDTAAAGPRFVD